MKCNDCGYPHASRNTGVCPNCGHRNMSQWHWIGLIILLILLRQCADGKAASGELVGPLGGVPAPEGGPSLR